MGTELEKRTIFAAGFGIAAPPASEAAMKRELGESPGQTRCCESPP